MYKRTEVLGNIRRKAHDYLDLKNEKKSYLKNKKEFKDAA